MMIVIDNEKGVKYYTLDLSISNLLKRMKSIENKAYTVTEIIFNKGMNIPDLMSEIDTWKSISSVTDIKFTYLTKYASRIEITGKIIDAIGLILILKSFYKLSTLNVTLKEGCSLIYYLPTWNHRIDDFSLNYIRGDISRPKFLEYIFERVSPDTATQYVFDRLHEVTGLSIEDLNAYYNVLKEDLEEKDNRKKFDLKSIDGNLIADISTELNRLLSKHK